MKKKNLKWMKLDNAAKIYPAARRRSWTNVFRISVTFRDAIEPDILQSALEAVIPRFPSVAVAVRAGLFWYYLEEIPEPPRVLSEEAFPLNRMPFRDIRRCAFRVLYYRNRISVEMFHSVTDGNGGLVFAKTLAAEYTGRRYGITVPATHGIKSLREKAPGSELEDSFRRHCGPVAAGRKESNAYLLSGTKDETGFLTVTTGILDADAVHDTAKKYGATVTEFLAAVMMQVIYDIQNERVPRRMRRKQIRILIPVNLRRLFDSSTMRNFASYITPGIDPRLGEYSFAEMVKVIHHSMGLELNAKSMAAKFTANVRSEQAKLLRIMPLFIKNITMKLVYNAVGERKSSICFSNLGRVELPPVMTPYVTRMDFVLGVQADSPCNCGVCSYGGRLYVNFIRNIEEPELERRFFTRLRREGLHILVESNLQSKPAERRYPDFH